jgi:hypothetical protein
MRLRLALLALTALLGGGVAGSAAPAAPRPPVLGSESSKVTCVYAYSGAICRGELPSGPDGVIYSLP